MVSQTTQPVGWVSSAPHACVGRGAGALDDHRRQGLRPTTEGIDLRGKVTASVGGIGSPSWNRHEARFDRLQPVEEAGDLFRAAEVVGERSTFVVALLGLRKGLADDVGFVVPGAEVATGRQGIQQPLQDRPCLVVVTDVASFPSA